MTRKIKNFDNIYDEDFFKRKEARRKKKREAEKNSAISKRLEKNTIKRNAKKNI